MAKRGPKRNVHTTLAHKAEVMRLSCQGWSQTRIGEHLGITQQQVSIDFRRVQKSLVKQMNRDAESLLATKLEEIRGMKEQLWEQWERSKLDLERITQKRSKKPDRIDKDGSEIEGAESLEVTKMREGRLAMAAYMDQIRDLIDMECKLHGLYPERVTTIKGSMTSTNVTFDWDAFAREGELDSPDEIEEKIKGVLGYTPTSASDVVIDQVALAQSAVPLSGMERNGHQ